MTRTDPIEVSKRRLAAQIRLREHAELERRLAKELHELTLRRMELSDQLANLKSRRGTLVLEARSDLYLTEIGDLLGVSSSTASGYLATEMKKRGMGSWM